MSAVLDRRWLWPLCVLVGYGLLVGTGSVRLILLDGLRALRRYPRLWMIPAGLGICYAMFHEALTLFFYIVLPMDQQPAFGWHLNWELPPVSGWNLLHTAGLSGLESLAGLFNNVVTTFPVSAVAAVMLLINWEDHHTTLRKALKKRMGRKAWLAHAGILLCAVSAILDPALFGPSLPYLNHIAPGLLIVRWATLIDWLSSLFAYLFGVGVQVYLILLVYTWLRGINWTPTHLMDMAIRRFSFVVKWAVVVMAISSVLIDLPRIFALMFRFDDLLFFPHILTYTDTVARPLLALFLIYFCSMQVTLTFHSETLRKALRQHQQFVRRFSLPLIWFLLVAAVHLFALAVLDRAVMLGVGGIYTSAGLAWGFVRPVLSAIVTAWLLCAWVSLYKRCETGTIKKPDWIPF